MLAIINQEPDT